MKSFGPYIALLLVQVLFGINYVVAKVIVQNFPPLVWASARTLFAGLLMIGIASLRKGTRPVFTANFIGLIVKLSLLAIVINQVCFLVGLHLTEATHAAVINTLIPVFTLLIVTLRGQEKFSFLRSTGFLLALAGVLVIMKIENFHFSDKTVLGDFLNVMNALSFALFLAFGKKLLEKNDQLWVTGLLFFTGSLAISAIAMPDWLTFHPPVFTATIWFCLTFGILGGTFATYLLNNWALARVQSSSVAIFIYLQPVVAAIVAYFYFGETITARTASASLLIFAGLLLVIKRPVRQASFTQNHVNA